MGATYYYSVLAVDSLGKEKRFVQRAETTSKFTILPDFGQGLCGS